MKVYIDTSLGDYKKLIKQAHVKDEYLEKVKRGVKMTLEEKIKVMRPFISSYNSV